MRYGVGCLHMHIFCMSPPDTTQLSWWNRQYRRRSGREAQHKRKGFQGFEFQSEAYKRRGKEPVTCRTSCDWLLRYRERSRLPPVYFLYLAARERINGVLARRVGSSRCTNPPSYAVYEACSARTSPHRQMQAPPTDGLQSS